MSRKIDALRGNLESLQVSEREPLVPSAVDPDLIRAAIREERKIDLTYRDENGNDSQRRVRPLAIIYYVHAMLLVSWCELRNDFRHFRLDRVQACDPTDAWFRGEGEGLREQWKRLDRD